MQSFRPIYETKVVVISYACKGGTDQRTVTCSPINTCFTVSNGAVTHWRMSQTSARHFGEIEMSENVRNKSETR